MGLPDRESMGAGQTPAPPQTITKPGEAGATTDKNAKDAAVIKLADSFGELARETAETLRHVRQHPDIRYYELRRWRKSIHTTLLEAGAKAWNEYDRSVSTQTAAANIRKLLAGDDTIIDSEFGTAGNPLPRWWWDLKEGTFDELTDELRGSIDDG